MKILVIGSGGFIGKHVVSYFHSRSGYNVSTADIVGGSGSHFLLNAVDTSFEEIFRHHHFDVCINCSGAANVQASFEDRETDYRLNVTNVELILAAINKNGANCKFINLSSAAVYGNPQRLPIQESDNVAPLSPYGEHKYKAEQICKEYSKDFGIGTVSLRIFSAYGEGLRKQLFWDLYNKLLNGAGKQVTLYGTGNESRDFIHGSDIAVAIACILANASFKGEVINVASGSEKTIREVSYLFEKVLGVNTEICFSGEQKIGDPVNWCADISLLKSFGFEPAITLEKGLTKYSQWAKEQG